MSGARMAARSYQGFKQQYPWADTNSYKGGLSIFSLAQRINLLQELNNSNTSNINILENIVTNVVNNLLSVENPPNSNTLKINNTILLEDISGNTSSISLDSTNLNISTGKNIELDASNYVKSTSAISAPSFLSLHQFDGFPSNSADITTISSLPSGGQKCRGGVLAPNGKIYCVPDDLTYVIIIDPVTDTIDTTTISLPASPNWWGGVLAPNGKIYFIPNNGTSVGILDPDTNTIDTTTISGLPAGGSKWSGGVLAPNGKIYGIPYSSTSVLIIDPDTNTIDTTTITGLPTATKYGGGVLAPNGKIYCSPLNVSNVAIIDPDTNTIDTTTITGVGGGFSYWGGALAPNGNIYFVNSFSLNAILVVDTNNNTTSTIDTSSYAIGSLGIGGYGWIGAVCAQNGYIYCIPFDWARMECVVIDPNTNTIVTNVIIGVNNTNGLYHCFGGVLAPNGKIYGMPASVSYIPIIKTGLPNQPPWMLGAYFNKF